MLACSWELKSLLWVLYSMFEVEELLKDGSNVVSSTSEYINWHVAVSGEYNSNMVSVSFLLPYIGFQRSSKGNLPNMGCIGCNAVLLQFTLNRSRLAFALTSVNEVHLSLVMEEVDGGASKVRVELVDVNTLSLVFNREEDLVQVVVFLGWIKESNTSGKLVVEAVFLALSLNSRDEENGCNESNECKEGSLHGVSNVLLNVRKCVAQTHKNKIWDQGEVLFFPSNPAIQHKNNSMR
mmetsp:Transcript_10139/g.37731  ORF Transcript_10139/g.37731 Transcript_10139/m.37731 type:complete len:237 (-) Transcript_10139:54-764(-)